MRGRLFRVEHVASHDPGAIRLAPVDAKEGAGTADRARGSAGLCRGSDREASTLIGQVAVDHRFNGRPVLGDVELLVQLAIGGDIRRLAYQWRPARNNR